MPKIMCVVMLFCFAACVSQPDTLKDKQPDRDSVVAVPPGSTSSLPYWEEGMSQASDAGYIDTFSVDGSNFRLVHHDSLFDGTVEKKVGSSWKSVFELEALGNHNSYVRNEDVNGDGYNDFQFQWKWDEEVYFYNPTEKTFTDIPVRNFFTDWVLLDHPRNIYFGRQWTKFQDGYSALYTFRGSALTICILLNLKPMNWISRDLNQ